VRVKKNLGRELSTETLRDEDGVGVHEMMKTFVNAIYENRFHGDYLATKSWFFGFRILEKKRGRGRREN
jgi:hypothetical protein